MTLVNGVETDSIPAADRGLAYGDGVFETLAVVDGDILNWPRHVARLQRGCERLGLPDPDIALMAREIHAVCTAHVRSVAKLIVTRGSGGAGYTPPETAQPSRIVTRRDWPESYGERERVGIRVCIATHRLPANPALAGIKHLNRLDQVIASAECARRGFVEALMQDEHGHFIEATRSNLFIISSNHLVTPALDDCGVLGVMRDAILDVAPGAGLRSEEKSIGESMLRDAEEVFLCNAIAGIWPVTEISRDQPWSYSAGAKTRLLQELLLTGNYRR